MVNTASVGAGYSTAAPTEKQVYRTRLTYAADGTKTGIVSCHGGTGTAVTFGLASSLTTTYVHLQSWLADCGWPIITPDLGFDTCGNDTASVRIGEARAALQAAPVSAKSGKVILMGVSMGGANAMKYALDNPANVAAMILLIPACDWQDIVTNNRGGFRTIVNAAYSGGYSDATYGAAHNPKLFAPTLAASNIPTWIGYATDDTTVIPSTVTNVIASLGSTATVGLADTGGHGDGFMSKLMNADGSFPAISSWLNGLGL